MIEVRLFGGLKRYGPDPTAMSGTAMHLSLKDRETLGGVLTQAGIDLEQVGNVFLNGRLLPRSAYPISLGYPLAAESPLPPERYLNTPVQSGDRLGIFPRNMGLVVV